MSESWRAVPGWEGLYEVSDLGRVRSLGRWTPAGRWHAGRARHTSPRSQRRYHSVSLTGDGRREDQFVHRLVLRAFVGECPPGEETRHLNGNPEDNRLVNLCWGTHTENNRDRVRHGTHQFAAKTHCPQGHPYDLLNTYRNGLGRACRTCRRNRNAAAYHRRTAKRASAGSAAA